MKMSIGKRILLFFHWLLSLLIVAAFAVYLIVPDFLMKYYDKLEGAVGFTYVKVIGIALLAVYVVLAAFVLAMIFKRKKKSDRGFITVDSSDSGKVRIAIAAIEQMVRQSVGSIDGITEMKIGIENRDDAIGINVNAAIVNGSHVPTITMNMQRAIRQFVETNCGVAVRTVAISINSVTNQPEAGRRRRRGKGQEAIPATATSGIEPAREPEYDYGAAVADPEPAPEPVAEPAYEPVRQPEYEPEPEPVSAPSFEAPAGAPEPGYDFDKPYESQFAKDLADLKARDAEEAEAAGEDAE